ncbi:MAG TPA: GspE/PulE family protein [Candidatus Baltobacteraceae bacterium]|nr:GspE/PulE family protein [Candidatus Baltobacteraceae bacterium]
MAVALKTAAGLLELLAGQGKLNKETFVALATEFAGQDADALEKALLDRKLVQEEDLARAKAEGLGLEFIDLAGRQIDPDTLNVIPKNVAETYQVIAYEMDGATLKVAFVDPLNSAASEAVGFLMAERNMQAVPSVTTPTAVAAMLKQYGALKKEVATALQTAEAEQVESEEEELLKGEESKIEEVIKGAPVSRIVSVVMRYAVESKASDIHIEPKGKETRVRYRIDGVLRTLLTLPGYLHSAVVSRVKVLANLKLDETRVPQDGRITQVINGKNIDFRISTLPVVDNEKVVMRVLDTSTGVPSLEQLGFRKKYRDAIAGEIRKPHGMILITGPTGSGKSTTLVTMLGMINDEGVNISTLEDPVEYFLPGVNQSQIKPEIKFTFANGLRALLRQDPNVIMVGEIRDQETGELGVHAALTGHLILTTIHTNDAIGVIPRLTDLGVEAFLLSATLNLIIAQRLARKICEHCKMDAEVPENMAQMVRDALKDVPADYLPPGLDLAGPLPFKKGKGCMRCSDTGYSGRTVIAELIAATPEIQRLMNAGFPVDQVKAEVKKQGWITMRQDAMLKVVEGATTVDEVLRLARE